MRPLTPTVPCVLVGLLLTGCLTEPNPIGDSTRFIERAFAYDGNAPCDPALIANCQDASPEPLRFRPIRLDARTSPAFQGIHLVNLRRSLLLEDATVVGFDTAIRIESAACPDCRVLLRHVNVQAASSVPPSGASPDLVAPAVAGIVVVDSEVAIDLDNVTIAMAGGGTVRMEEGSDLEVHSGGSLGLLVRNSSSHLRLSDVRVTAREPSSQDGVRLLSERGGRAPAALEARNLSIERFWHGIHTDASEVSLARLTILGCAIGVEVSGTARTEGSDWLVDGSERVGLWYHGDAPDRFSLQRFTFSGGTAGAFLESSVGLFLEGSQAPARLRDGAVQDNALVGTAVAGFPVEFENVSWSGNGKEPSTPTATVVAYPPGGLVAQNAPFHLAVRVHNSSFVGNQPYAVRSSSAATDPDPASTVDARGNWWGDPLGPRVSAGAAPGPPPVGTGNGDVVTEGVEFVPFLRAPPTVLGAPARP